MEALPTEPQKPEQSHLRIPVSWARRLRAQTRVGQVGSQATSTVVTPARSVQGTKNGIYQGGKNQSIRPRAECFSGHT